MDAKNEIVWGLIDVTPLRLREVDVKRIAMRDAVSDMFTLRDHAEVDDDHGVNDFDADEFASAALDAL